MLIFSLVVLLGVYTVNAKSNFSRDTGNVSCPPLPSPVILCPNPPQPNVEIIYSSYEDSFPEKECASCGLKLNEESTGVFVRCFRCQNVFRPPELVETDKCVEIGGDEMRAKVLHEQVKKKMAT